MLHFNARQLLSSRRSAHLRWRCCSAELGQEHLIFFICTWSYFLFFPALPARLSCPLDYSSWILTSLHPARGGKEGKRVKEQERLMLPAVLCWKPTMVPPALVRGWEWTCGHFMSFSGDSHSPGIVQGKHLLWSILTVPWARRGTHLPETVCRHTSLFLSFRRTLLIPSLSVLRVSPSSLRLENAPGQLSSSSSFSLSSWPAAFFWLADLVKSPHKTLYHLRPCHICRFTRTWVIA